MLLEGPHRVTVINKTRPGYKSQNRWSFSRFLKMSTGDKKARRPIVGWYTADSTRVPAPTMTTTTSLITHSHVILWIIKKITKSPSSRISQFYHDFFSHRELPRAVREILLPITADERGQRRCHGLSASRLNTPCYRQDSPTDSTRCFAQTQ